MNYGGIYHGVVTRNTDPENRHRVMVKVPQVLGAEELDWAEPCVPVNWFNTGTNGSTFKLLPGHSTHTYTDASDSGVATLSTSAHDHNHDKFVLQDAVPKVGAQVWVMFVAGDINYPVWMGVPR